MPGRGGSGARVLCEVRPPWPYRLPGRMGSDRVARVRGGLIERLVRVDDSPVLVRAWTMPDRRTIAILGDPVDPADVEAPSPGFAAPIGRSGPDRDATQPPLRRNAGDWLCTALEPARREHVELAVARMRHALCVDDDLSSFYDAFRSDRLIGPAIRRMPWLRARRRPWPWEALLWALAEQLIESERAAAIERRIVRRWSPAYEPIAARLGGRGRSGRRPPPLRDVPGAKLIAGRAPAELAAMDLAPKRALAMVKVAREVASGRVDPGDPSGDRRLLAISEVGPWTVRCLALKGRGDLDALPAGDLAYIKLVGGLAGLGRRATVAEVEEFFAPYAPFRGLAGTFALAAHRGAVKRGPPLRAAA